MCKRTSFSVRYSSWEVHRFHTGNTCRVLASTPRWEIIGTAGFPRCGCLQGLSAAYTQVHAGYVATGNVIVTCNGGVEFARLLRVLCEMVGVCPLCILRALCRTLVFF